MTSASVIAQVHVADKGSWIWSAQIDKPNTWMAFRKQVELKDVGERCLATIAADSKYWLWINNELVVREGGLKRTPSPYDTYADTLDIHHYLKTGKNTISVLVWYWGKEGHGHNNSGMGGLYFHAVAGSDVIASDKTWKVAKHTAFDIEPAGPQPYRPLSEFNISFDARKDLPNWYMDDFDDREWDVAETFGLPPIEPWGKLVIRQIPQWKDFGLKPYLNTFPTTSMGNILAMQLPYNAQITPYFKIKAPAGLLVNIQTDKYTDGGAYNVRAAYITKEGIQEFESPGWLSGEQVWYNFPAGVELLSLQYRETGYDAPFVGTFFCNDDFYNRLWEKSRRTLYVNMRDNFMDCPTRERAMWWGDVVHESLQSYYVFSPAVHALTRKAIHELVNWQTDDSILYSPMPGPHPQLPFGPQRELPLQSLAAISDFSLGSYLRYIGDAQTLIKAYPAIKRYLSIWELGDDGLVKHRDGKWNWQDWGTNIDVPLLDNVWYYSALAAARDIAVLADQVGDTLYYGAQMRSIAANFDRVFWDGSAYRSQSHHSRQPDDRGNAMAVLTGLARPERWAEIEKVLTSECHAGPYMEKFVLEALFVMGQSQVALERMKSRYEIMVVNESTTLWELWEPGFNQSTNHGWTGGPLALLMQYVVGIAPVEPNYEKFVVKPRLGYLTDVQSVVPTSQGEIAIRIHQDSVAFNMALKIPNNTSALIDLPDILYKADKEVRYNNHLLSPGFLKGSSEIKEVKMEGKIWYQIKGGTECQIEIK